MRSVALLLAGLALLGACAPTAAPSPAATAANATEAVWTSQKLEGQLVGYDGSALFLAARDAGRSLALPLPTPAAPVERSVAGSVAANQVAVFTQERGSAVHLLDLTTGHVKVVALAPPGPTRGLAWSPDGRFLVWGAANTVGRIDRLAARPEELLRGVTVDAVVGATAAGEALYQEGDHLVLAAAPRAMPQVLANGLADSGYSSPVSPDGRNVILSRCTELCEGIRGTGPDHATVYNGFVLDRSTGAVRQVTQRRPTAGLTGRGAALGWLSDNQHFLWVVRNYSDQPSLPDQVFRVDAATSEVVEVFRSTDLYSLRMSADGHVLFMHTICCARLGRTPGFYAVDLATGKATAVALPDRPGLKILGVY